MTILLTQNAITVNPSLYQKVPFDPLADFAPVAFTGEDTNFVAVTPALPTPEIVDQMTRQAVALDVQSRDDCRKVLVDDLSKWKRVMAAAGGPRE